MSLKINRWATACLCTAVVGMWARVVPAYGEAPMAGDKGAMAGNGMATDKAMAPMNDMAMNDAMSMMKDAVKDDAGKMKMSEGLAKMMVMHQMAMQMCTDEKCMASMKDPAMMKVVDDAKKMAADPEKMAAMRDAIMKDPAAMKMTMMMSTAASAMMKDMPASGMDGGKMDGTMKPAMSH